MAKTRWTVDEVMEYHPCDWPYPRPRTEELWGKKKSLTLAEIMELPVSLFNRSHFAFAVCHGLWATWVNIDRPVKWPTGDDRDREFIALALEHYE